MTLESGLYRPIVSCAGTFGGSGGGGGAPGWEELFFRGLEGVLMGGYIANADREA